MKKALTYLLLLIMVTTTTHLYSYNSLTIRDPHGWQSCTGSISEAVFSVTPRGAFTEIGMYLTFSTNSQYCYSNIQDTFEVQLFFDLPKNSHIIDSWLWVGNQIVQADLIDRTQAYLTYEGIVQRRQDPSVLYKNSETQYELRVYPLAGTQTRKVKITYLVPNKFYGNKISAALPINILKTAYSKPALSIFAYEQGDMINPMLKEVPNAFNPVQGEIYKSTNVASTAYANLTALNISYNTPLVNGTYVSMYPTAGNEGYYQSVFVPSIAMNLQASKKVAIMFNSQNAGSTVSKQQMLTKAKEMLHANFVATDSFNLFFSQLSPVFASPEWLPADSATIESTFAQYNTNIIANYSNLPSLLSATINFIKDYGADGRMVLFSSSAEFGNNTAMSNDLHDDVNSLMQPYNFPIDIIDCNDQNSYNYWINNTYYHGNQYLYNALTSLTGGRLEALVAPGGSYYYLNTQSFDDATDKIFTTLNGMISAFDTHSGLTSGFCYSRIINTSGVAYFNTPVVEVGKYYGTGNFELEVNGFINAPFSQVFTTGQTWTTDERLKQFWVGNYINALEAGTLDNAIKKEISDSSMNNRVLSMFTAFLALEPSDSVQACEDCEDETGGGGNTSIDEEVQGIGIKAMPNPFTDLATLQITLPAGLSEEISIEIYNLNGQLVKSFKVNATGEETLTLQWDGTDISGQQLGAGVYLVVLKASTFTNTIKLVKAG
jgi:hypothetical protein